MMLTNMYMEIDSRENNGYWYRHATADSMKLINKLKSMHQNKTTQDNSPPTPIAPLCEQFTTINIKKANGFTKKSRMVRSKKIKGRNQKCGACNQLVHYRKSRRWTMASKTMTVKDIQDYSQVLLTTLTPSRFINI